MTPTDMLKVAARVAALDISNQAMQREIERMPDESIQLELAQIKFQVNQQFNRERTLREFPMVPDVQRSGGRPEGTTPRSGTI